MHIKLLLWVKVKNLSILEKYSSTSERWFPGILFNGELFFCVSSSEVCIVYMLEVDLTLPHLLSALMCRKEIMMQ